MFVGSVHGLININIHGVSADLGEGANIDLVLGVKMIAG